jgi:hypothetical protein
VIVAVIPVRMMEPSVHEVVDMVTMGHRFVPAGWAVLVCAACLRGTLHGVGCADGNDMFVDVILVHVVEVAIMEIIDVPLVADPGVSAVRAVVMGVIQMMPLCAGGHNHSPILSP